MRTTLAGIAVLVALNCPAAAQDIKIGFLGTFTGPLSAAGGDMRDAANVWGMLLDEFPRDLVALNSWVRFSLENADELSPISGGQHYGGIERYFGRGVNMSTRHTSS